MYGNVTGIFGAGLITNNRVFGNAGSGIWAIEPAVVTGNTSYNNGIGIEVTNAYGATSVRNNLVYGNATAGISVHNGTGTEIVNNTVYQPTGDGIRADGGAYNLTLKNNIVTVGAGVAVGLAVGSEAGLDSDYNNFYLTGAAHMGKVGTREFLTRADWFREFGFDAHSISANPQFADPDGADDLLGDPAAGLLASYYNNETFTGAPVLQRAEFGINTVPSYDAPVPGVNVDHFSVRWQGFIYIPADGAWTLSGSADEFQHLYIDNVHLINVSVANGGAEVNSAPTALTAGWHAFRYDWVDVLNYASATLRYAGPGTAKQVIPANAFSRVAATPRYATDDNFRLLPYSPSVDAGNPASLAMSEPSPNGLRINQGHEGNTVAATASAAKLVQVLSPNGSEKMQAGRTYTINWRSVGLVPSQTFALLNLGGGAVGDWNAMPTDFLVGHAATTTYGGAVNTSGVTNPAPAGVYQSFVQGDSGVGSKLVYRFPVPDGAYALRLHWQEISAGAGQRKFDVRVNGVTVLTDFDIFANAGNYLKAVAATVSGVATGGTGVLLELVNKTANPATLCGVELAVVDPAAPSVGPTVDVQVSTNNGVSWATVATNQAMDGFGRGAFPWTPNAAMVTAGNTALVRVIANVSGNPQDASDAPFVIGKGGNHYYVNDALTAADTLTTAAGNNANSGKSPDQPMASLAALLAQYDLGAGDVVHVDDGTYNLASNVVLRPDDSGVTIQGPATGAAVFNRGGNNSPAFVAFQFANATDDVTLDRLTITNAYFGVNLPYQNGGPVSHRDAITRSEIFGNYAGIYNDGNADGLRIVGNRIHDNLTRGVYLSGSPNYTVTDNKVYNHAHEGINATGVVGTLVAGNEVYANATGILAGNVPVTDNVAHDNTANGIWVRDGSVASGNVAYRQATGVGIRLSGGVGRSNVAYANAYGLVPDAGNTLLQGNRAYSNTVAGIYAGGGNNTLYDNLVYANANFGVQLVNAPGAKVSNNTVYQSTGDAIRLSGSSTGATLRNNVLWVEAGADVYVAADSQTGFDSDYNLLYKGSGGAASVGFWNNAARPTLGAWQAANGLDAHSTNAAAGFIDIDGADNVLGFAAAGAGYDGGVDDNFSLAAGFPAIDHGHSWLRPTVDLTGAARADDPGTGNAGSSDYVPATLPSSLFTVGGVAQNFKGGPTTSFSLNFPGGFSFPFYDGTYTSVRVGVNGVLEFGGAVTLAVDPANSLAKLGTARVIAPMWDTISTLAAGDDVFVDTATAGRVTIRWKGVQTAGGQPVNFAVVLFADGKIRFDYGTGNAGLSPTIGVSYGNGQAWTMSPDDGGAALAGAGSVEWALAPGVTDMGAYEFLGSTVDATPPTVVGSTPAAVVAQGSLALVPQVGLSFSEPLAALDAASAANYDLRAAGPDHVFDTADDVVYAVVAHYAAGATNVTLDLGGAPLAPGQYRLTVFGLPGHGLRDRAGLPLYGGVNYVRTFNVTHPVGLTAAAGAAYAVTGAPGAWALNVTSGSVAIDADLLATFPGLSATVAAGATLTLSGSQHLAALTLSANATATVAAPLGAAAVLSVDALSIAASARLDIGRNYLAINYANGQADATLAQVAALVNAGRNGGAWNGAGINSNAGAGSTAIGFADNAGPSGTALRPTFGGQAAPANCVLVRFTLNADANLDGVVDFEDLVVLAQNYNAAGGLTWSTGDFTGDGVVDFEDLVKLAQNYNTALPAAAPAPAPVLNAAPASVTVPKTAPAPAPIPKTAPPPVTLSKTAPATATSASATPVTAKPAATRGGTQKPTLPKQPTRRIPPPPPRPTPVGRPTPFTTTRVRRDSKELLG